MVKQLHRCQLRSPSIDMHGIKCDLHKRTDICVAKRYYIQRIDIGTMTLNVNDCLFRGSRGRSPRKLTGFSFIFTPRSWLVVHII